MNFWKLVQRPLWLQVFQKPKDGILPVSIRPLMAGENLTGNVLCPPAEVTGRRKQAFPTPGFLSLKQRKVK